MGKKKQTKVTKKGGLIYSKAEWKEEYPAFRSGGGDENLVPRRPKKGDRERRARPYSEPVLSEINVDEPYDEEKARTLDRPSRPKSVMVGGPEARTKSPSRQPSRNLLSCLQIPEEQDEDEAVVTGDVPRIVVEEVDQPPTKRARQEPTKRSPQDPRRGRYGDVPMETNLPIEAIHLAGPAKPGRDARGSPAKPTGTGTEASLDRRGPGTKSKPGNEGRDGTPDTDEKGKGKKKKVFGGKKKEKEDSEKDAQEGKKKQPKEKKKEKERKNKKAAEKGNEREDRRQSPEGDDGTLQLWEASLDRDPHGRGRPKDKRSSRQSPENMAGDDLAPTRVDDLAFTPVPVEHVTLAPAANMAAAPPQSEARVQAAPAYASRPEIVRPSEAPSDAPRMIKITFPVEQGVQTSPKSTPTSPTYLSPTSARPVSPESSPEHRRDGERGRARQRRTPEGGALEGEFLRRRSPLGDRYIVEKARLLDANVTPTDYAKMEAELESRSAPPGLEYPEHRSGAVPEYLVIGGLEHRSIPTQTTSSVFSRPSYSYTDSTATIAMATHADTMATHADTMATHPDSHALRKVVAKEVSVSSLQDMSSSPGGEAVSGEMVTTETQEYKLYSSSSSFKTIEMYGAKFTLVGPTPTVVTETTTTSHITGTEPEYVTATSYVSGTAAKPGSNQMQYTTSTSHMPGTTPETHYVTSYVSGAQTQPDASHTQYTTSTGYVAGAHPDASPMQHTSSVTTYSAGPTQYAVPTQPASTSPSQYAVQAPQASTGPTQYTVPAAQVSASPTQYTVPAQPAVVVRREAATIQTVQQTKAANREAAVVESSHDIEIRPLRMEEETREEASPRSPEVIVSNLSPVRETVATFEQPTPDDQATSQYKLNYMHFPGRDTTITVVKRLSAGPTTLEGQQPEGEGGADLQADLSQRKPEVTYETKMVVTEVKSEVRQQKVPEASYTPEEVKVNTGDLQESAPIFETKYEERAVDVPLPEVAPAEEEVAAEVPEKKEKKKKKKRSWFRKGSSSSTSDDHSDAAEKPVTTVMAGDGVDAAVAMATVDDRVDADVAMATVSKLVEGTVVTTTTTRVVSGVEAGPERGMLGMEASVEPREIPEATLHAGKAEPGQGGAGDDLEGVGKVVMAEVKHEPMVLKDKPTGEGEEMRTVGREITEFEADPQLGSPQGVGMEPLGEGSPYEKWRWEEINVVIKHQQDGGKTDVEGVETTWKRVPDVGDGEGEETTGVFDDSYRANNWIYVGDDEELPSAQSTPKGSPVMHSMGTSTDDDDDLPVEFSRRQVGRESTGTTLSEASFRQRYRNASRRKRQDTSARLANLPPAVRERTIRLAKQPGVQFGFRIQKSRPIVITEVDKDSPAERAGIRVGDILTSVQNRDVTDCKHSDAVSIIKQGPTDRLTLTVATTLGNTLRDMGGEPVATGYLHKLSGGRVGKQWRKRWFVLKKDNTLYYYKTREDKEPLGTIVLANYTITPAHEIGRTHAFKASRFNTRTYYFSAATEEEMEMWSRLLNQASAQSAKLDVWLDISMNNVRLPALSIPEPDFHGYLSKLGYVHKVWRRRYCVLKDGCLYYYTDYNSKRAIGVAHFHGYRVEPMTTTGKSHAFSLTPPSPDIRTFYFSADNESEKLKWMEHLEDSLGRWIKVD
ncbi:uncharacterized protein LOC144866688 isoform X4 [Branchiostoma floridae x Branchiostoma japonicum]